MKVMFRFLGRLYMVLKWNEEFLYFNACVQTSVISSNTVLLFIHPLMKILTMICFIFTLVFGIPLITFGLFNCRLPTIQQEVQQRKLLYMGLYLLIWGEAANLRFMPECLCYIYHHVCFQKFVIFN